MGTGGARLSRPDVWTPPQVNRQQIVEALFYDYADRAEWLGDAFWQDFPEAVADGWWRLRREQPDSARIRRSQAEEQTSVVARWVPLLRLHDWYRELFEVALNQSLWALRAYLSRDGRIFDPTLSERWVRMVAPDARTSQSRGRSRILRPPGPLPTEVTAGRGTPVVESAGVFTGWIRAAYIESYAIARDDNHAGGRLWQVRSGLVAKAAAVNEPISVAPRRVRWHELDVAQDAAAVAIAQLYQQMDATAWDDMLAPVTRVRAHLRLRPAPLAAPLDLLDADDEPAVSLRYWRMRPHGYDYGPQTPMIDGVGLFLRADLLEELAAEMPDLEVLTVVDTHEVGEPTETS